MLNAILVIVTIVVGLFWGGFVTSTLWNWFAVPLGVVAIGYGQAIGLSCLAQCLVGSKTLSTTADEDFTEAAFRSFAGVVFIPAVSLFVGWVFSPA